MRLWNGPNDAMGTDQERVADQVERLAKFILDRIPGEPSRSEGAIDCAIRIMGEQQNVIIDHAIKLQGVAFIAAAMERLIAQGHAGELIKNMYARLSNVIKGE